MSEGTQLPAEIAATLAHGTTILTGNQRAARSLQHRFDLHNRSLRLTHWTPPAILAWDAWTAGRWQQLLIDGHTNRLLLNRTQEHTLWREIIAADPEALSLRSADSLAELAADAWARLCAYRGEPRLRSAGVSADTRAFVRWALAFDRRCRAGNYLSAAQLEAALLPEIAAGRLTLPPGGFVLTGFDAMTPARQALVEAIRSTGCPVEEIPAPALSIDSALVVAEHEQEELDTAARWIRQYLEAHPGAQVALIVPGLEDRRAAIERTLRNTLAPELHNIAANASSAPFEFSLGVPLASTPLVATALDLLHWTIHPLPLERISRLLLSPHFAGGGERHARAAYDAYELRRTRTLRLELTLDGMLRAVASARRSSRLPKLHGVLRAISRGVTSENLAADTLRLAADWAEFMRSLLHAAGWDGNDSIEFQTRRKWESLLDELATLDFEGTRLPLAKALEVVNDLAGKTLFAPESRNAPVQVMGPLESAGSTFDALWFLGAGDLGWPPRPGTIPLLSWSLQRELRMPGSDVAEDSEYARRMTARLANSASTVVFSYPQETADGRQRASASLNGLALRPLSSQELLPPEPARKAILLDDAPDNTALPALPDQVIRGGADLLRLQAACGFRAFAEKRLWATSLDATSPGMDARERGNAVHIALQHLWREVKTQAALKAMPTPDRRALLAQCIDIALREPDAVRSTSWDAAYMDVQRERLLALLDPWLLQEMRRAVPFTVRQSETELPDARIGPLRLRLRVDRIDETEFGDVILDYKTGAASPSDWLTDRPDQPQLPLYAVLSEAEQLAGVAFAEVRAGRDMGLSGYQTQDGILLQPTSLKEAATLDDQVDLWRETLTHLAYDFAQGDARVLPKKYPTTCLYCGQRLLCRLDPTRLEAEEDADTDEIEEETQHA